MKIYIAGHSNYGECVFNTLKFFKNDLNKVDYMIFDNSYEDRMEDYIRTNVNEDLIVITDFLGGSVNACAMKLLKKYQFKLFTGVNMSFLLELIFSECDDEDELKTLLKESKNQTVFVNDLMKGLKND